MAPGSPLDALLADPGITPAELERKRVALGLDQPCLLYTSSHNCNDRCKGIFQGVLHDHFPFGKTFGLGGTNVVVLHNFQHTASHVPYPSSDLLKGKDQTRQDHVLHQISECMSSA